MKTFLVLINMLFCVLVATADNKQNDTFFPILDGGKKEYTCVIQLRNNTLTGICVIKKEQEKYIGTFVNEFGIKGFDFMYDVNKNRISLFNVIKFLNKWYIKRTLKKDLKFMITNRSNFKNKKREIAYNDSSIVLTNNQYDIIYNFNLIAK